MKCKEAFKISYFRRKREDREVDFEKSSSSRCSERSPRFFILYRNAGNLISYSSSAVKEAEETSAGKWRVQCIYFTRFLTFSFSLSFSFALFVLFLILSAGVIFMTILRSALVTKKRYYKPKFFNSIDCSVEIINNYSSK